MFIDRTTPLAMPGAASVTTAIPAAHPTTGADTLIFGIRIGHGVRIQCLLLAKALGGSTRVLYREDLLTPAGRQVYQDLRAFFLADPGNAARYYADSEIQARFQPDYAPDAIQRLRRELEAHPPRRVVFFEYSILEELMAQIGDLLLDCDLQYVDPDRRPMDAAGRDLLDFDCFGRKIEVHYPVQTGPARLACRLSAPGLLVRKYNQREFSFVTHGGGWAMGDFRARLDQLAGPAAILLPRDRALAEREALLPRARLFFDIETGAEGPGDFARLAEVTETGYRLLPSMAHHGSLDIIARSRAIVSKPGGGTLVDSYLAQTPILYLDPISHYEAGNVEFIEQAGIGMRLEAFLAEGAPQARLEACAANLARLVRDVPTVSGLMGPLPVRAPEPAYARRAAAAGR